MLNKSLNNDPITGNQHISNNNDDILAFGQEASLNVSEKTYIANNNFDKNSTVRNIDNLSVKNMDTKLAPTKEVVTKTAVDLVRNTTSMSNDV